MGAYAVTRKPGLTDREFFQNELSEDREIIASAGKRTSGEWQGIFYAAVRDTRTGEVWALIAYFKRSRGDFNFTYRMEDETQGPYTATCPASILDVLTPTDDAHANGWRQRCRDHIAFLAAQPKLTSGDTIKFPRTLSFTDGTEADTFEFVRRDRFLTDTGRVVRISGWRTMTFVVV